MGNQGFPIWEPCGVSVYALKQNLFDMFRTGNIEVSRATVHLRDKRKSRPASLEKDHKLKT